MDSDFSQQAIKVFKALADPTRYQIIRMLIASEELSCEDFDCVCGKSKPAMSHHYRVLQNAGLVANRKDGLRVFYRLEKRQLDRFVPRFSEVHCPSEDQEAD